MTPATADPVAVALAGLDDASLDAEISAGTPLGQGIGGTTVRVDVAGTPVFVKRVPLTDVELAHPRSTANLFGLPTSYQYGVGSPGFNAWRELAAHEWTTEYVRAGGRACFPLLHHWRVLPRIPGPVADLDPTDRRWRDDAAVQRRIGALTTASSSLVLFLEYVPETLASWWSREDPDDTALELEQRLHAAADALLDNGLLHLDAHPSNLLHDGRRLLVGDFGLVTSAEFDLDDHEKAFAARHLGHDRAYLVTQLVNGLVRRLVPGASAPADRNTWIAGPRTDVALPAHVRDVVERYAPVAGLVNAFYWQLHAGDVTTRYPYEEIDAALDHSRRCCAGLHGGTP